MSNSVRPHRRQPTKLPRPWGSPGKNTRVGCHFLLQCKKVKSESEVAQSCPTLHDLMDCSMPDFPVHYRLPEFTQIHVHPVGDAIQPSHPLLSPSSLPSVFPSVSVFPMSQFTSGGQRIGVSASASVLLVNIKD